MFEVLLELMPGQLGLHLTVWEERYLKTLIHKFGHIYIFSISPIDLGGISPYLVCPCPIGSPPHPPSEQGLPPPLQSNLYLLDKNKHNFNRGTYLRIRIANGNKKKLNASDKPPVKNSSFVNHSNIWVTET